MPYKKGKFKCQKCDNEVHRKETKLCMKCRALDNTGKIKVNKEDQKEKRRIYKKKYFQKNKDKIYNRRKNNPINIEKRQQYYIKSRYGISLEQYKQMLIDKNYCCDICGYKQPPNATKMQKLYIDHDHKTKRIRGLICSNCNAALGYLRDNIAVVEQASKYLKKWQDNWHPSKL